MDLAFDWLDPQDIFRGLAEAVAPFEGLSYETIGALGVDVAPAEPVGPAARAGQPAARAKPEAGGAAP